MVNKEVENIQNPNFGAFLIWNFTRGYYSNNASFVPFPILFIVIPMLSREDIVNVINSTNRPSGLRVFANKFISKELKNDVFSQIHISSLRMKELTLNSIRIALFTSLISLDYENATAFPNTTTERRSEPQSVIKLGKASEKLGYWCSQLTIHEISQILKVRF